MTTVIPELDGEASAAPYAAVMEPQRSGRSRRPSLTDAVLGAALAVAGVAEVLTTDGVEPALAAPLIAVAALALAWRRRLPFTAFAVTVGISTLSALFAAPIDSLNLVIPMFAIAQYSVAAHAEARRAVLALGLCLVAVVLATFAADGPGADNLLFGSVVAGGPWLAGWLVRRRTEHAVALALRAQELERSQAAREETAVAKERTRIAREIHDIVAHSVSVMTVQAGAVEEVVGRDAEAARAAASSIRRTGQQAQHDLRRLLGVLRDGDDRAPLAPQPGLTGLDDLLASVRRTGIAVDCRIEGEPRDLPPGIDLSAFRVLQEALTNVLKHARATTASVGVHYGQQEVAIEVVDDGIGTVGSGSAGAGGGHGLAGMRERVALFGGELDAGPGPGGGFRVRALLPVEERGG